MLKNIFINLGSCSSIACIKQFCTKHADYLEKEGFWLPDYEEIFQKFPPEMSGLKYNQATLLTSIWQDLLDIPSSEENLKLTRNKLLNKSHIHSLIYLLNCEPTQSPNNSHIISLLKQIFPSATLNICWIKVPLYSEVENNNCIFTTCYLSNFHLSRFTNNYLTQQIRRTSPQNHLPKGENLSIDIIQCEGKDILYAWQKYIGLTGPYPQMKLINFIVSPKVLAFIMAIQTPVKYKQVEGKYILLEKITYYDWLDQEKLLEFENDNQTKKQYLRESWKNKLNLVDNKNTTIALPDTNCYENISESPLSVSAEDAQILTSLLTPDFRKLITQDIDKTNLKYKTQDVRNVQGALLLAEKLIDNDEFKKLTAHPKGVCLPIIQDSIIEVCDAPPVVAVLTLCYNHKDYIEENILSVMAQETKFPVVHIISDDASTDGTQEILKKYAAKYPHIHLILRERNNSSQNILGLFNQAKTPYVALCDGDDYFTDPSKLQSQVDLLEANPDYGLCFHLVKITFEDSPEKEGIYPNEYVLKKGIRPYYYLADLIRRNIIQTNSVMYRWRFRDGLPSWFNPNLCPGDWYWHLLHAECGKIGFINKVMSVYRRHKNGLFYQALTNVVAHHRKFNISEIALYEHLNVHFEDRYKKLMSNKIINILVYALIDSEKSGDNSSFETLVKTYPHYINNLRIYLAKLQESTLSK